MDDCYEVYIGKGSRAKVLRRGQMTIVGQGAGRFHEEDLRAVGIDSAATLLINRQTCSLSIRRPRDAECGQTVSDDDRGRRRIWLGGAIRAMGLDPARFRGRHECKIVEDRLEIC